GLLNPLGRSRVNRELHRWNNNGRRRSKRRTPLWRFAQRWSDIHIKDALKHSVQGRFVRLVREVLPKQSSKRGWEIATILDFDRDDLADLAVEFSDRGCVKLDLNPRSVDAVLGENNDEEFAAFQPFLDLGSDRVAGCD